MENQNFDKYFAERHSYRTFDEKPVSREVISDIIRLAMRAPTTGNMQLYSVLVCDQEEMLMKLRPLHFNQPASKNAKAIITVCADFNRFARWCRLSNADPGYENFLSFTSAMLDATILAQQITTIAEMKGFGTCYLGTATYNADKISELLGLPEMVVPVACLAIGWPAGEAEETERLPLEAVCTFGRYPEFSDDDILRLYEAKDKFPANSKYVEENGKQSLAQVFTDVRYPKAMNEEFSAKFLQLLKEKKFL